MSFLETKAKFMALFNSVDSMDEIISESHTYLRDLLPKPKGWKSVPKRQSSFVYFIMPSGALDNENLPQFVKIGVTSGSPSARLATFQTGSPSVLEIVACIEGGEDLESALHQALSGYRDHGEWFVLHGPVHEMISHFDAILMSCSGQKVIHPLDFAEIAARYILDAPAPNEDDITWFGDTAPLLTWFKSIGLVRSE